MDSSDTLSPLHEAIAAGLSQLGMPGLPCQSTTFLIRDGNCAGRRFLFEGVEAVWLMSDNVVRFCDQNGQMLKSIGIETNPQEKAA